MTNGEILKKVVEKAEKSGLYDSPTTDSSEWSIFEAIIFGHDFAKAFWGEEILCNECGKLADDCDLHIWDHYKIAWQYHIQQMVIEKEPLKYLEKFL